MRLRFRVALCVVLALAAADCDDKNPPPAPAVSTPAAPTPNDAYWQNALKTCEKQTEHTTPTWQQCINNQYETNNDK